MHPRYNYWLNDYIVWYMPNWIYDTGYLLRTFNNYNNRYVSY
jgi:hypothetical protein